MNKGETNFWTVIIGCIMLIGLGIVLGDAIATKRFQRMAVEAKVGLYNSQTAQFEFIKIDK